MKDNIDIVLVSTNDDPRYNEFWPMIRDRWISLGVKPICIQVSNKWDNDHIDDHIDYAFLNLKIPQNLNNRISGRIAAISRLYAVKWFSDKICMISDIDLYPLNKDYYDLISKRLNHNNVVISNYMPYSEKQKSIREFRMCHIIGNTNLLSKIFNSNKRDSLYEYTINTVVKSLNESNKIWVASDELYITKRYYETSKDIQYDIIKHTNYDQYHEYMLSRRKTPQGEACPLLENINSKKWSNFHMPMPYSKNKDDIFKIIKKIETMENDE